MDLTGIKIDYEATGKRIKKYVQESGLTVTEVQIYLGLHSNISIYRWYTGLYLPSVENLLRLSVLFNVHMEDLLVYSK